MNCMLRHENLPRQARASAMVPLPSHPPIRSTQAGASHTHQVDAHDAEHKGNGAIDARKLVINEPQEGEGYSCHRRREENDDVGAGSGN
jgi:hypothetical protein